jgi:hypothetical protein
MEPRIYERIASVKGENPGGYPSFKENPFSPVALRPGNKIIIALKN